MEDQDTKTLWNLNIKTYCVIEARRSDIVFINMKNMEKFMINVTIPGNFRAREKQAVKLLKY